MTSSGWVIRDEGTTVIRCVALAELLEVSVAVQVMVVVSRANELGALFLIVGEESTESVALAVP